METVKIAKFDLNTFPVFRGGSVISITYNNGEWFVFVDTGELRKIFEGEFKLL
jgi:hypothetical protein